MNAQKPEILKRGFAYGKQLFRAVQEDECPALAARMAFSLILSLVPACVFLLSVFALLGRQGDVLPFVFDFIAMVVPDDTEELIRQAVVEIVEGGTGQLTFWGLLGMLLFASLGARMLMTAMYRVFNYADSTDSPVCKNIAGVLFIVALGALILLISLLILFGGVIISLLAGLLALPMGNIILLEGFRWLVSIIGIAALGTMVYLIAPVTRGIRIDKRQVLPGVLFFTIAWLVVSVLYNFYIENINEINPVYGALGAIIALLSWMHLSFYTLLIGGEMTALRINPPQEAGD